MRKYNPFYKSTNSGVTRGYMPENDHMTSWKIPMFMGGVGWYKGKGGGVGWVIGGCCKGLLQGNSRYGWARAWYSFYQNLTV